MAGENQLFHIDTIVADGKAFAFEDTTATISGAAGFKNDPKLSASGDDFVYRSRVPRMLKFKVQVNSAFDPKAVANMSNIQISMRDSFSNTRFVANRATFESLGELGAGSTELSFILTTELVKL
jgi:hypothetical protein